jgi:hypothetical protein
MQGNEAMQALRADLLGSVVPQTNIAVLFTPTAERLRLGEELLIILPLLIRQNAINSGELAIFVDEGFFPSRAVRERINWLRVL